jgi:hypothetical protein
MLKGLGFSGDGSSPKGDYIAIAFPASGSKQQSDVNVQQRGAREAFMRWRIGTQSGLDLVKELFPTKSYFDQMKNLAQ